jgi:cobalt-zinc-cadmium efflux system outer membrane protein
MSLSPSWARAAGTIACLCLSAAASAQVGPPAPPRQADLPPLVPRDGPLPAALSLQQALEEAEARSPAIVAARSAVEAAGARVRQAGFRSNPELSLEVENFAGTGELTGFRGTETTVALNQRLDLGGRRQARVGVARAELAAQQLRLSIARADLAQQIREQFARAVAAKERLQLAEESEIRARELARLATILVEEGRDPPLRALRARSAAAQVSAEVEAARAEERASRATLAALFGATTPIEAVTGPLLDLEPRTIDPEQSLEVRLADVERLGAEAALRQELAAWRLDPALGLGVRHVRETGDVALVGGVSMPLPFFDRNQGNVAAARANVTAAEARRAGALATISVRARNAIANVQAAETRVGALEKAAIPEASEALRLAQIAYREGRASLLELLDVQTAYTNAQAALTEARLALALATAELGRVAAR